MELLDRYCLGEKIGKMAGRGSVYICIGTAFLSGLLVKMYQKIISLDSLNEVHTIQDDTARISKVRALDNKKHWPFSLNDRFSDDFKNIFIAALIIIVVFGFLSTSFGNADIYMASGSYVNVQVGTGDTVWSIASRYTSNKENVRDMIFAIKRVNKLNSNAQIYPGQILKVPIVVTSGVERWRSSENNSSLNP